MNKNYFIRFRIILAICFFTGLITSCDKEKETTPKGAYQSGVFIVNEGNFGTPNGEISFFNRGTKEITNNLFQTVNSRPLGGDVVQSLFVHEDKAYIICNNSNPNKIEVTDANTFNSLATITGLALPRYMKATRNKGYISEWVSFTGNGRIAVVDLTTHIVTKTIAVGKLPEQMILLGNQLFVVNSGENTVSVLNTSTDAIEHTLPVADSPNSILTDKNNNIWILCGGKKVYASTPPYDLNEIESTAGALVKMNPSSHIIEQQINFSSKTRSPSSLISNKAGDKLYYTYGGQVYAQSISAATLENSSFLSRNFYGIGIDPKEDIFYGAISTFTSNGKVIRYNLNTGATIDSVSVGIGPNSFVFRD